MTEPKNFLCEKCLTSMGNSIHSIFFISIVFKDNQERKDYSLKEITEILNKWLDKKLLHLSATELILARCDQMYLALNEQIGRPILFWGFSNTYVCENCYLEYIKEYPLR